MNDILGINYYFEECDTEDRVFEKSDLFARGFVIRFKEWIERNYNAEVHTWDCIRKAPDRVKAVLYFDYSWRYAKRDKILSQIPFDKRALAIIEPANVNPSLYYVPFYRNRFKTIFTWDERLLARHREYIRMNVPVGAEPAQYKDNRFSDISFADKKMLVAVSRNCWSYMPQSTYRKRVRAYRYFSEKCDGFDLFGHGWNADEIKAYRGPIEGDWDRKVATMAKYRFALCFENNASQPGYISEKILDCFCARCVPVYYGSRGIEKRIPRKCFIDFRDFGNFEQLRRFIGEISEHEHSRYLTAIDEFMNSDAAMFFSTEHYFRTLAENLKLTRRT